MGFAERIKGFMGYPADEFAQEEVAPSAVASAPHPLENGSVALVRCDRFEDASTVVDHLLSSRMVLFSLANAPRDVARRLIDFLGGAAYSKNAQISRISEGTYLITPYNVEMLENETDAFGLGSILI